MYLLENDEAVVAFNNSEYGNVYQREMTVAEHEEGKRLYDEAAEFFKEFIGEAWTIPVLERLLSKVRHNSMYDLMDRTLTATEVVNDELARYVDVYVSNDSGISILVTLSEHNVEEDVVGKVHLYSCYNQDISGLDYSYEDLDLNTEYQVVTANDIAEGILTQLD